MSGQTIRIVRADDLLVCELELDGLEVAGIAPSREFRAAAGASTHRLILHLPTQHVAEAAAVEQEEMVGMVAVRAERGRSWARAAGPSRVVFVVPGSALPVPYRLAAILELLPRCSLSVPASAGRAPGWDAGLLAVLSYWYSPPALAEPAPEETAIELPFRLILSPQEDAGFHHASEPVTPVGTTRTELWHSRLGLSPDLEGGEEDAPRRPVRAIWMRSGDGLAWSPTDPKWPYPANTDGGNEPFPVNALSQRDRHNIVHLSGNRRYMLEAQKDFFASPVFARRLALSSLGAWLDARGDWDPPPDVTSLIGWTHRATQGRDHFVRIVDAGFLYPFGHPAVKVTITERKFLDQPGDPAPLQQRTFIVVRRPLHEYPAGAAPTGQAFTMPLQSLQVKTLITPNLAVPAASPDLFVITAEGSADPFLFRFGGTDWDGNTVEFVSPLVWIISTSAWNASVITTAQDLYGAAKGHEIPLFGTRVALAPGQNGDSSYAADTLVFTAPPSVPMPTPPPHVSAADQPGFWPELDRADVHAPALEIVVGQGQAASVKYHPSYRDNGLGGSNRGEVIAELAAGAPLQLGFGDKGDRAGGLMQPNMAVTGLSRRLGPVGGAGALTEMAAGTFDPKNFFAGALSQARMFGVFTLDQVLARITGSLPSDTPRIVAEGADPASLVARIEWKPVLQSYPPTDSFFVVNGGTQMEVTATIDAKGAASRSQVTASLSNFELHLLPPNRFIEIAFNQITFATQAGRKPDVDVKLGEIRFVGPLSFIEELKKLIPLDGFSDPPALEVTPTGVTSSFSLSLPSLAVGVFSLENISIGAGFAIPFADGPLTVSFDFCKREEPFLLAVALFGGGGFAGLAIDPNGVQLLEASFEFGAVAAIDLGVAQGGVHVMAGIFFKIESGSGVTLTGYFRLGGNMSVLGLISCSIELYLSFTYQGPDPGKAVGQATITVEIDIFMFSMSVQVSCERKFAGSANDPSFRNLMGPLLRPAPAPAIRPWTTYCEAYA